MKTYVYNKVLCSNKTAAQLFIRYYYPYEGYPRDCVVTLEKINGRPCWSEEKIYSGYGAAVTRNWDKTDIRFCTLDVIPMKTILAAIRKAPDIRWYVCDDNFNCIYRYHYDGKGVWEDIFEVDEEAFEEWIRVVTNYGDEELELEDCDCALWHFVDGRSKMWKRRRWNGVVAN